MKMPKRDVPKTQVKQLLQKGWSVASIARRLGCCKSTVTNRLKEWGWYKTRRVPEKEKRYVPYKDPEILKRAYERTPSTRLLGVQFGVATSTIKDWMLRNRIPNNLRKAALGFDPKNPWTNETRLSRAYKKYGAKNLARKWGCDNKTIFNWLNRFKLKKRAPTGPGVVYPSTYRRRPSPGRKRLPGRLTLFLRKWVGHCQKCGDCEYLGLLDVHHFDHDRFHNEPKNLAVLCVRCHALDTREIKRVTKISTKERKCMQSAWSQWHKRWGEAKA